MNAKSKIFLALALVLSVTACSKGGGSHAITLPEHNKPSKPIIDVIPPKTDSNTYLAYKPEKDAQGGINKTVGNNVWTAFSGEYGLHEKDGTIWKHNLKPSADYDYIQFGDVNTDYTSIRIDPKKPNDKLFINASNNAMIGIHDDKIFIATPWNHLRSPHSVQPNIPYNYEGPIVFHSGGKVRQDLTMNLNITYGKYDDALPGDLQATIHDSNGNDVAILNEHYDNMGNDYIFPSKNSFVSQGNYSFLNGQKMVWAYTDKDASGITGILGQVDNSDQFGVFIADKKQ
ncbi:hypothetical protein [Xenorhabdus sp. KJ12.1]|uniref:hypothetical protein n=1 Tax=Xenorhabdus sp. KJ12.1 TaxID=1851571 RepID=UPI000C053228|nr:hypothetical protein [Xenorhabdus sp. KJ12.1]PHM71430.1 outer membrane protein NilC [Xenorhabdus sp. KJ12.1]